MAYLISNRKLIRLISLLISITSCWMIYWLYQTQLTGSRDSLFHSMEDDNNQAKATTLKQSNFDLTPAKLNIPNNQENIQHTSFPFAYTHVAETETIIEKDRTGISIYNSYLQDEAELETGHLLQAEVKKGHVDLTASRKAATSTSLIQMFPSPDDFKISKNQSYLVYLCDSSVLCGGWGDRQRGLTSLYFISRVVGRQFKLVMTTPCDLSNFYQPNRVDWRVDARELDSMSSNIINSIYGEEYLTEMTTGDFNKKFPHKVLYVRTNSDLYHRISKNSLYAKKIKQWTGLVEKRNRFRWAWHDLMTPSFILLKHLEYIVGSNFLIRKGLTNEPVIRSRKTKPLHDVGNSTLICGHVRIGKNPTIPTDEDLSNFRITDLPTLFAFMRAKGRSANNAFYFVASDYDYVREKSRAYFKDRLIDYGGKIIHIDRQRDSERACVGFEVALIDQMLLSLCDVLIICKSGFSRLASYLNNSTENIFIIENGQIEKLTI